jgi:hypothetical protein
LSFWGDFDQVASSVCSHPHAEIAEVLLNGRSCYGSAFMHCEGHLFGSFSSHLPIAEPDHGPHPSLLRLWQLHLTQWFQQHLWLLCPSLSGIHLGCTPPRHTPVVSSRDKAPAAAIQLHHSNGASMRWTAIGSGDFALDEPAVPQQQPA